MSKTTNKKISRFVDDIATGANAVELANEFIIGFDGASVEIIPIINPVTGDTEIFVISSTAAGCSRQ